MDYIITHFTFVNWMRGASADFRRTTPVKDSLYTFPTPLLINRMFYQSKVVSGLARDYPRFRVWASPNSPRFSTKVSFGSCVIPSCTSIWQFAQMRTHLSISFLIFSQERVSPFTDIPKLFSSGLHDESLTRVETDYIHISDTYHLYVAVPFLSTSSVVLKRPLSSTLHDRHRSAFLSSWYTHIEYTTISGDVIHSRSLYH